MIREAQPKDLSGVLRLYRQLHRDDPDLDVGLAKAVFERISASQDLHLLVLDRHGIAATTYLAVIPNLTRSGQPYAVIENVVVDEALRGIGLGKQIMQGTLRAAWAAGCYKAMLMTGSRNLSTHRFYRACGFSPDDKTGYVAQRP